ncbi:carbonic anhydrase family protein, partial [Streptomyces acidicola]|uniref:carbonic anhydrase family protein n=1 Tax=Streptomyces acidicola TaxID=2596892 RepID=UPI00380C8AAD
MSQTAPTLSAVGSTHLSQSPVDIRPQDTDSSALPPLRFHHPTPLALRLHFDGPGRHRPDSSRPNCTRDDEGTVKAEPPPGQECLLSMGADTYRLVDVHWHTPSEHTVGGVAFPMEQHMKYMLTGKSVRAAAAGESGYAVIGVFVHPGQANGSLDRLLASARRSEESWEVPEVELDTLLPSCTESYRYLGSTTVCPYTPGVRWTLLTHPV